MKVTILYDGEVLGAVNTNRNMTLEEALELIDVDINEMIDEDTRMYDPELFEMSWE